MLIYSMSVSVDGFIADREGAFGWSAPAEELFGFHLAQVRELGGYLCGRRLYETMLVWETDPSLRDYELGAAFADVWCALPKVVFSRGGCQREAGQKGQNQYRRPKTGRSSAPRSSRTSPTTSTMIPIVTRIEMFNNHPMISRIRPRTTIAVPPDRRTCRPPPAFMSNVDPQPAQGGRSAKVNGA